MAFIGKVFGSGEGSAKAQVAIKVSCSKSGRLGVVFRNGLVPEGTLVDVLVGTGEDHGLLLAQIGESKNAQMVKSLGHLGNSTSWSGIRAKATKALPEMKRRPAIVKEQGKDFILIDLQLGADVTEEGDEEIEAPAPVEEAPAPVEEKAKSGKKSDKKNEVRMDLGL